MANKKIKILMMGGRRCGKTSVLAAMDDCCVDVLACSDMEVKIVEGSNELALKKAEAEKYFSAEEKKKMKFIPDMLPSPIDSIYTYQVEIGGKDIGYDLEFRDFPGEYLANSDEEEKLQKWFNESQVIVIAIDTPHLVEKVDKITGVGKYHTKFNRVDEITRYFKSAFKNGMYNKMVIFVPLKCEKYYYRKDMDRVIEMVKKGYSDLFEFLASPDVKSICTVAIAPILTFGGAEFLKFKEDSYVGEYNYRPRPEDKYAPLGCEQPLFLVLKYLVNIAKNNSSKKPKILRWFDKNLFNKVDLNSLIKCEEEINEIIKGNKKLPVIFVQDPLS